jgi:hypothetical protein
MPAVVSRALEALGTCSGNAAAVFNKRREGRTREEVLSQRDVAIAVAREMIDEAWPRIATRIRRLQSGHNGCAPYEEVCAAIMHVTGLQRADEAAVATLVKRCVADPTARDPRTGGQDFGVDVNKLWAETVGKEKTRRPPSWERRFQADGCLDAAIQKSTTGVERNAWRYAKVYTGAPYAVTADAACVEELASRHQKQAQERMRSSLMARAQFVRYDDPRHPDHPEHKRLTQGHDYEHPTSASAKKTRDQIHKRDYDLPAGGEWMLPMLECRHALLDLDKGFLAEREAFEMTLAMDPKMKGWVRVEDIMRRFAFELLKPKACRNTLGRQNNDGVSNALEWPSGVAPPVGVTTATARQLKVAALSSSTAVAASARGPRKTWLASAACGDSSLRRRSLAAAATAAFNSNAVTTPRGGGAVPNAATGVVGLAVKPAASATPHQHTPKPPAQAKLVPHPPVIVSGATLLQRAADGRLLGNRPHSASAARLVGQASALPSSSTAEGAASGGSAAPAAVDVQHSVQLTPRRRPQSAR